MYMIILTLGLITTFTVTAQPEYFSEYIGKSKVGRAYYAKETRYQHKYLVHVDMLLNFDSVRQGARSTVGWTEIDCKNMTARGIVYIEYSELWGLGDEIKKGEEEEPKLIDRDHILYKTFCDWVDN